MCKRALSAATGAQNQWRAMQNAARRRRLKLLAVRAFGSVLRRGNDAVFRIKVAGFNELAGLDILLYRPARRRGGVYRGEAAAPGAYRGFLGHADHRFSEGLDCHKIAVRYVAASAKLVECRFAVGWVAVSGPCDGPGVADLAGAFRRYRGGVERDAPCKRGEGKGDNSCQTHALILLDDEIDSAQILAQRAIP